MCFGLKCCPRTSTGVNVDRRQFSRRKRAQAKIVFRPCEKARSGQGVLRPKERLEWVGMCFGLKCCPRTSTGVNVDRRQFSRRKRAHAKFVFRPCEKARSGQGALCPNEWLEWVGMCFGLKCCPRTSTGVNVDRRQFSRRKRAHAKFVFRPSEKARSRQGALCPKDHVGLNALVCVSA